MHGVVDLFGNQSRDEQEQRHRGDVNNGPGKDPRAAGGLVVEQKAHVGAFAFGSEREGGRRLHIPLDPRTGALVGSAPWVAGWRGCG